MTTPALGIAPGQAPVYRAAPMPADQPLFIALVALQFTVHALGWAMAAALSRGWQAAEGQFAAFWLLVALGLTLYVPAWPSGSAPRNVANILLVGAAMLQHRGLVLHWGRRPPDRAYVAGVVLAGLAVLASLALERGHGLRVATVCVASGVLLLGSVLLVWRHGRRSSPRMAWFVMSGYGLLALVLLGRALQALVTEPAVKIAIDAPGHGNLAMVMAVLFLGGLVNLVQIQLVLGRVLRRLTSLAQTDTLTGAVNRRGLLQRLELIHERVQRAPPGGPGYAVLMVDVDHFKAINDRHGHAEGDRVLVHVASTLKDSLRSGDVVARWGGEEFCVLLPRVTAAEAQALAVRMAARIAASGEPRVTVSVGVAEAQAQDASAEDVIRRADAALYRAKAAGRNRVVSAPWLESAA